MRCCHSSDILVKPEAVEAPDWTTRKRGHALQEKEAALKLELADARLQQAEAEAQRHAQAAASYRQQYEEAADIVADMGKKYEGFEQGIKQNMEAGLIAPDTYLGPVKASLSTAATAMCCVLADAPSR